MYNHWLKWKINNKIISNNWGWKWIKKRRSNYFFINWNKIKDDEDEEEEKDMEE